MKQSLSWTALFYALLAYTVLLVVPVSFQSVMPYLDAAWGYDLNYFLHSSYHFGPDLIFSYGPLGFLNNPHYLGNHIPVAITVHVIFLIALGWQLRALWRSGYREAAVLFCVAMVLGHRLYYDYWDYNLLALSVVTIARLLREPPRYFDLALVPALAGITFLLKFTTFIILVLMLGVFAFHLLSRRPLFRNVSRRLLGWVCVCVLAGPLAYLIYDRSLGDLLQYVRGAWEIASGFATAMSTEPDPPYLVLAAAVALLLLLNAAIGLWKGSVAVQ